jgi:hypothetical protein
LKLRKQPLFEKRLAARAGAKTFLNLGLGILQIPGTSRHALL